MRPTMVDEVAGFEKRPAAFLQIAAGCFGLDGYGEGVDLGRDLSALDALVLKTTTLRPLTPARLPRFEKLGDGNYWNYVGLRNPGIDALDSLLASRSLTSLPNLWLSLYAESTREYLELIGRADVIRGLIGYEINLSCPNLGPGKTVIRPDVRHLEDAAARPLRFKLSLAVEPIESIGPYLEHARSVVIGNSLPDGDGGLSGPILRPRHCNRIAELRNQRADLEIIGCGGIASRPDALEYLQAGADKVQLGAYFRANGRLPADLR